MTANHPQAAYPYVPVTANRGRGRAMPRSAFTLTMPLLSRTTLPAKSVPAPPPWAAADQARRKRERTDTGARSSAAPRRVAAAAAGALQIKARAGPQIQSARPATKFTVGPNLTLQGPSRAVAADDEGSDKEILAIDAPKRERSRIAAAPAWLPPDNQVGRKAARKVKEVIEIEDEDEDDENVSQLMTALDGLTLATTRLQEYKQLPFLRRNLRRGFAHRCQAAGVHTGPRMPPSGRVGVLYRYCIDDDDSSDSDSDSEQQQYQQKMGWMADWRCPLCALHSPFDTRDMLSFHLRCDHSEVEVTWKERDTREYSLLLELTIPDSEDTESLSDGESETSNEEAEVEEEEEIENKIAAISPTPDTVVPPPVVISVDESAPPSPVAHEFRPKKQREESPIVVPRRPSGGPHSGEKVPHRRLPARYPSPPPRSDRLGPAARYPYLPEGEVDEEGNPREIYYSCRPGGPKIYDLLNTLSLEPFGVLSWLIVDREEELFELDDVRDEDKVMLALWNRWIMLNRVNFVYNDSYCRGVMAFVDEYWEMIHRAAGWGALRAFLLMLVANKFLDIAEVVKILKYYETYTGMDLWDEYDSGPDS